MDIENLIGVQHSNMLLAEYIFIKLIRYKIYTFCAKAIAI